ncbi:TatD family hydrolase [bacterium]|nr:TatD family hydrolase [bacterium]
METKIINTHSHINMLKEYSTEAAIKELEQENIIAIVPASSPTDIFEVDDVIKKSKNLYGYVGVFPEEAREFTDKTLLDMENIIKNNNKIVGIGEIGLDYYWDKTFKDKQKEVFIKQIHLANELNLPLNIHSREAHFDTLEILKKYNKNSVAIMHCFSGSLEFAKECIKNGIYISLGGVVTFKNAKNAKDVAANIPIEYLLLETDDPYLTPVPFRGKENRPSYVKYVAQEIANLRNCPITEVAQKTTENALKIFPQLLD